MNEPHPPIDAKDLNAVEVDTQGLWSHLLNGINDLLYSVIEDKDASHDDRIEAALYVYGLAYSEYMFKDEPLDVIRSGSPRFVELVRMGMRHDYPDGIPIKTHLLAWDTLTQIEAVLKEVA